MNSFVATLCLPWQNSLVAAVQSVSRPRPAEIFIGTGEAVCMPRTPSATFLPELGLVPSISARSPSGDHKIARQYLQETQSGRNTPARSPSARPPSVPPATARTPSEHASLGSFDHKGFKSIATAGDGVALGQNSSAGSLSAPDSPTDDTPPVDISPAFSLVPEKILFPDSKEPFSWRDDFASFKKSQPNFNAGIFAKQQQVWFKYQYCVQDLLKALAREHEDKDVLAWSPDFLPTHRFRRRPGMDDETSEILQTHEREVLETFLFPGQADVKLSSDKDLQNITNVLDAHSAHVQHVDPTESNLKFIQTYKILKLLYPALMNQN
jgi:hypothetical protein